MSTDEPGFQALYDEFHAKVHNYLARLVAKDEADDLTQEVFMKINKALPDAGTDAGRYRHCTAGKDRRIEQD